MTYFIKIILCVNFLCVFLHACDTQSVEPCEIGGEAGACVPLPACAQFVALLKNAATTLEGLRVSRARQCGFEGQNMKVCCPFANPSPPPTPSPPPATRQNDRRDFVDKFPNPDTGCGEFYYYAAGFAWNGKPVKSREMVKWMAILGYKDAPVFWQCGGSIITARHVLTAAHCVKPNLYVVRIGELNLEQEERDASPIDFLVKKAIPHEAYTKHHNDIAVLVLDGTIDFEKSTHVTPICLPLPNPPYAFDDTYDSIFVAGWGETENRGERPSALLYAPLNLLDREECAYAYRNSNVTIDARVLCVGDKEGEHDACNGDSGGPLVRKFELSTLENNKFIGLHQYQLGIVSYGFRCSLRRFLGVYTNVFYFIPWLEEKVLGRAP